MEHQNPHRKLRFNLVNGMLESDSCISGPFRKKRFQFIRNHPWASLISLIGVGVVAATINYLNAPFELKREYAIADSESKPEQTIVLPDSFSFEESYFPIEEEQATEDYASFSETAPNLALEPISNLEKIANLLDISDIFDEEKSWEEYNEKEQTIFAKYAVTDEDSYLDIAEGRRDIKPLSLCNN